VQGGRWANRRLAPYFYPPGLTGIVFLVIIESP